MDTVDIEYIGNKKSAFDNVAHSGKTWAGKGDVQGVTPAQASILLQYQDQWRKPGSTDAANTGQPAGTNPPTGDGADPADLSKPLEKMTKAEIKAYALQRWGKELDVRKSAAKLVDEVAELEANESPLPGSIKAS